MRYVNMPDLQHDIVSDSSHNGHPPSLSELWLAGYFCTYPIFVVGGDTSAAEEGESGLVRPVILFCSWASARETLHNEETCQNLVRSANPVFP